MKRIIPVIGLSLLSAACQTIELEDCDQLGGPKSVTITYGDEGITVVHRKQVKRKSVFIIKLKPTSNDYKDNVVTIDGKSVTPGGVGVPSPDWLDTSDDYDTRKKFVYCTPDIPAGPDQDYKYSVEVDGLGLIDPRVEVTY